MFVPLIVATFLLAHGLIHALYLAPPPPERTGSAAWPFTLERSWLLARVGLDTGATRTLGTALIAVTIAAFALAAVGALGVLPDALWVAAVVIGATASLALLGLFFQRSLLIGMVIDGILLWAVLVAAWGPDGMTD